MRNCSFILFVCFFVSSTLLAAKVGPSGSGWTPVQSEEVWTDLLSQIHERKELTATFVDTADALYFKEKKDGIELWGKSRPIRIQGTDTKVLKVTGGKDSLEIAAPQGQITIQSHNGEKRLALHSGRISVSSSSGSLMIFAPYTEVELDKVEGRSRVEQISSQTKVMNSKGSISWQSTKGLLVGTLNSAEMELQTLSGNILLKDQQGGKVRGQNQNGTTTVHLKEPGVGMIFGSQRGDLKVTLAKEAKYSLQLESQGRVIAPPSVRVLSQGKKRVASGRTSSSGPGATIQLISETGQILVTP